MVMDDNVQEEVVCSTVGVVTQRRPAEEELLPRAKDGTQVSRFCDVSFCSNDNNLLLLDGKNDVMSQPETGNGYYIDGKGRKRRFSLRILAKKKNKKCSSAFVCCVA
jgi:hypothetical protein